MIMYIHKVEAPQRWQIILGWTRKNKFKYIDVTVSVGSVHLIHVQIIYINFACFYILLN